MDRRSGLKPEPAQSRRRAIQVGIAFIMMATTLLSIGPAPVSAETNTVPMATITGASVSGLKVTWGSLTKWSTAGTVKDREADGYCASVWLKLDRKGVPDTAWFRIGQACGKDRTGSAKDDGFDPTNGAWFKLCVGPGNSSHASMVRCGSAKYVRDDS
jgi:hypothetical protein